jgi:hypothetical protein
MTSTRTAVRVHALPAPVLDAARTDRTDANGHPVESVTAAGGEPLRCCLRDAEPAEDLILFGYRPPLPASPYQEVGPVYAHAAPCPGPGGDGYPTAWRSRPQVLRGYDRRGWMHAARVHDGTDPERVIQEMFADPAVVQAHSRNVAAGCFMFRIARA